MKIQDEMDIFKRQLEEELRLDMEREVSRIRQVEVNRVKVEESQKHSQQIEVYREHLETQYFQKLDNLQRNHQEA